MANLKKIVHIGKEDFTELVSEGEITINNVTYYYDNTGETEYIVEPGTPEYAETSGYATYAGYAVRDNENNVISTSYVRRTLDITYSELAEKVSHGSLSKGQSYRITDFCTITPNDNSQPNNSLCSFKSAGHAFDLIVTATSVSELYCKAQAVFHTGDTYFSEAGADLSKWQIWYDINNDTSKYLWADTTNGKGVIYRMIDEWGNDCPYDFKNIQFKRKLTNGVYDETNGIDTWVYTFNAWNSDDSVIEDASLITDSVLISDSSNSCYNNVIGVYRRLYADSIPCMVLNDIVFLNIYSIEDEENYFECSSNTFKNDCQQNTFGNNCCSNTFGINCTSNTFMNNCTSNTFMNNCHSNTFGNSCTHNTLGYSCNTITFGNSCTHNTLGYNCHHNTFGNNCDHNTLGNICNHITFGNNCHSNTFGDDCEYISFGNSSNQGGTYCSYNIFGNETQNIRLYNTGTAGLGHELKNIYVAQGVSGTINNYVDISTINRNLKYRTTVAKLSNGTVRIYCEDEDDYNAIDITYFQLKALYDNGSLAPGRKYRIINYVTTTTQNDTSSAQHAFDLVVTAISESELDCKAQAVLRSGDTYFSSAGEDLSKWQVWYDINNDTSKYLWADTTSGKGVIYRMIDEWGNDCPYDFKNIQFKRKLTNGVFDRTNGTDTWVYTFSHYENGNIVDYSLNGMENDVTRNIQKEYVTYDENKYVYGLTNNVFFDSCTNNILGRDCNDNTFGGDFWNNTLLDNCFQNIFGSNCLNNTLGICCTNNWFGNNCVSNSFGNKCETNTLENNCINITLGNGCCKISFRDANGNYGNFIRNVTVESGNKSIRIFKSGTQNESNYLQNIYIAHGFNQTLNVWKIVDSISRNLSYRTTVAVDSNGNTRIYNEDDIIQPDWGQTTNTAADYIKNKPTTISGYGITDAGVSGRTVTIGNNSVTVPTVGVSGGAAAYSHTHDYLPLSGGQITGPVSWSDTTALPEDTAPDYVLCVDPFTTGGMTKYSSLSNLGFKTRQTAVSSPAASSTTSTTFIDTITQNANGVITATKKTIDDKKVYQQASTANDYKYWRPILIGSNSGSSEGYTPADATDSCRTFSTLTVQPSSGTIRASKFKVAGGTANQFLKANGTVDSTSYKPTQTAVTDPTASSTTSGTFIDSISQDTNGVITATKKTVPLGITYNNVGIISTQSTSLVFSGCSRNYSTISIQNNLQLSFDVQNDVENYLLIENTNPSIPVTLTIVSAGATPDTIVSPSTPISVPASSLVELSVVKVGGMIIVTASEPLSKTTNI